MVEVKLVTTVYADGEVVLVIDEVIAGPTSSVPSMIHLDQKIEYHPSQTLLLVLR